MPAYKDKAQAQELLTELWIRMIRDTPFGPELKASGMSILFQVSDPEMAAYVDADGPLFEEEALRKTPEVTMKMSLETVHRFWLKKINVPKALALGQIKAKGPVAKVLKVIPLLKPGHELYPEYCAKYGVPTD